MAGKKKILFVVPYPTGHAPSQRFRVEFFLPYLDNSNCTYTIAPFLDKKTYSVLYKNASILKRSLGVAKGFLKRIWLLFQVSRYDYLFVHREASPLGPPFFEFLAGKILGKKIIYDFDDAIWIKDSRSKVLNWFKANWKVRFICKWAYKVVGGNEFLCGYARQFNNNVVLIPTCVNTESRYDRMKDQGERPITIGWTGSHSTLRYLDPLVSILKSLSEAYDLRTVIICNEPPQFSLPGLQYIPWNEVSEIDDLLKVHVGIMPLQSDAWSEGKCGFKLIQYLSLGIPAIASPVGVNKQIIEDGVNGFLCTTNEEWHRAFVTLIENIQRRREMGECGRKKIVAKYSIQAYERDFVDLFS